MNTQKGTVLMPQYNANWTEYEKLVMYLLEQHTEKLKELDNKTNLIHTDIASFKSNARFTGALAGFIVSLLGFLFNYFRSTQPQ